MQRPGTRIILTVLGVCALASFAGAQKPIEDWTRLDRVGTKLRPIPPTVAETYKGDGFTREIVLVQWRPLDPIYLYIIRPNGVKRSAAGLYLYSYPQDALRFLDNEYCKRVARTGIAAIGFESALTGERYRMRPMREWFVSELQESLACSVHDVSYIIDYLSTRPDINASRIGMFGMGSGATIAVLAASVDRRIKAIDLINPWADWPSWMKTAAIVDKQDRQRFAAKPFLAKIAKFDPITVLPTLKIPVRMNLVGGDPNLPDSIQGKLANRISAKGKVNEFGDGGDFYRATSGGKLFEWLARTLIQR